MPEGKSVKSSFNRNQKAKYQRALKSGYSERVATRLANGTLRR